MPEIPGVSAKIGADVSGYKSAMVDAAEGTKKLADAAAYSREQLVQLAQATEKEREALLKQWDAANGAAQGIEKWTAAQQRAAMAASGMRDEANRMNEAFDKANDLGGSLASSMLGMVGVGAAAAGGFAIVTTALDLAKNATVGAIEGFADFGHRMMLLHETLDIPLETAAAWDRAAGVTGISAERVVSSLAMMDTRLANNNKQAVEAVNDLGISFVELRDASPDRQVELLAQGLAHAEAEGRKLDPIIKGLMGRGGLADLPFLTEHNQEYIASLKAAEGSLTGQAETAQRYEESVGRMKTHWESIWHTLAEKPTGGLATLLERVVNYGPIGAMNPFYSNTPGGGHGASGKWDGPLIHEDTTIVDTDKFDRARSAEAERAAREKLRAEMALDAAQVKVDTDAKKAWTDATAMATQAEIAAADPTMAGILRAQESYEKTTAMAYAKIEAAQASGAEVDGLVEAENAVIREAEAVRDATIAKLENAQASKDAAADEKYWADIDKQVGAMMSARSRENVKDVREQAREYEELARATQMLASVTSGPLSSAFAGLGDVFHNLAQHDREIAASQNGQLSTTQKLAGAVMALAAATQIYTQAQKARTEADVMNATVSGAAQGAAAGAAFGGVGAGVGAVIGGALGFITASHAKAVWEAQGREIAEVMGQAIDQKLQEMVIKTAEDLGVSLGTATLLDLDQIMSSSRQDASNFEPQIERLLVGIADHSVPAAQGVTELSKAFNLLKLAAESGSVASEQAMISAIQLARALGVTSPEMSRFIKETLTSGAQGLDVFFSGQGAMGRHGQQQEMSGQVAAANEHILGANFQALAAQEGVVKAAEDLQASFDELMKHVPKDMPMDKSLEHMAVIEKLLQDADFKHAAASAAAGALDLKALLDTGNLTQETTDAFATDAEALLQQAIDAAVANGYSPDDARIAGEEANAPLLAQLQHAEVLGTKLSPEAEAMLKQAQQDGTLPLKTVAEQQLEELRGIHGALDKAYTPPGGPPGGPPPLPGGTPPGGGGGGGGGGGPTNLGEGFATGGGRGDTHFHFAAHGVTDAAKFLDDAVRHIETYGAQRFVSAITRQQQRS